MWRLHRILAAVALASCVSAGCSSGSERIAGPTPVDSGGTQQPGTDPSRPPSPPPAPGTEPAAPEHPDRCDHRKAQWALGQAGSTQLLERARVATGAETARFLRFGEATTLEYRIGRLNLVLDAQSIVRRVECW
jgi:hypothetical protein